MSKTVKLADVARAAGVSQGTVSNVFNRPDLVSESLKEKVETAARGLGYRGPDPRGRLLRAGRVNAVGVVISDPLTAFFHNPYQRRFLAGIAEGCDEHGAGLALVSARSDETAAWNIRTALVDGFILNCLMEGSRLVDLAVRRGLPFVAVDFTEPGYDQVRVNDRRGARMAAEHLIALGHRTIAVLALEFDRDGRTGLVDAARAARVRFSVTRDRLQGYRDALQAAGLGEPVVFETLNDAASAAAGVEAVLAAAPGVTAMLCMSDVIALAACQALAARGLKVPGDIAVAGFDDTDEAERAGLTTVHQPIEEKGRAALRMVLERDDAGQGSRLVELPLRLVIRATTGPVRP
jgi:DNA-binding LacI/PurR family transcriptional regulator